MTLKLFKDRIYYTAYIDDWKALVELCQATKGDKISVCGYPNMQQKTNINDYTEFTIKIQATEVQVKTKLYYIDASLHNTGASKMALLKHMLVNYNNKDRVSTSLSCSEIVAEMQSIIVMSGK